MESSVHTTIRPRTNIMAVAEKENTSRYAIGGALVLMGRKEGGWLIATNGRMMAAAHAGMDRTADSPVKVGPILPLAALPASAREVRLNGRIATIKGTERKPIETASDPVDGSFPPCDEIAPKCHAETVWLHLNAKMLADLAAALNDRENYDNHGGVYIGFNGPTKPLAVMDTAKTNLGVLMPINQTKRAAETSAEYNALADELRADWNA